MENFLNALVAQTDWAILFLRIVLGVIFIGHGFPKLKNFKGTASWLHSEGFKPGWFWAAVVGLVELVGGVCILVGLSPALFALILIPNMLVAMMYKMKKKVPFQVVDAPGWEFDLLIIAALILLATLGEGFLTLF